MNASFGLFPPIERTGRREPKRERHRRMSERALRDFGPFAARVQADTPA
jgi:folate-dependent tRNA-U54 methylase TrmFO/GidA